MKILASNNTMTYLKPAKWWMNLLKPIYRCQNRNLIEQLEAGVNYIYLNIRFNDFGVPVFTNGLYQSKKLIGIHTIYGFVKSMLNTIKMHKKPGKFFIRLDLDISGMDEYQENLMEELCNEFDTQLKEMGEENIGIWTPCYINDCWRKTDFMANPVFIDSTWYERLLPFLFCERVWNKRGKEIYKLRYDNNWRIVSDFI